MPARRYYYGVDALFGRHPDSCMLGRCDVMCNSHALVTSGSLMDTACAINTSSPVESRRCIAIGCRPQGVLLTSTAVVSLGGEPQDNIMSQESSLSGRLGSGLYRGGDGYGLGSSSAWQSVAARFRRSAWGERCKRAADGARRGSSSGRGQLEVDRGCAQCAGRKPVGVSIRNLLRNRAQRVWLPRKGERPAISPALLRIARVARRPSRARRAAGRHAGAAALAVRGYLSGVEVGHERAAFSMSCCAGGAVGPLASPPACRPSVRLGPSRRVQRLGELRLLVPQRFCKHVVCAALPCAKIGPDGSVVIGPGVIGFTTGRLGI